MENIEINLGIIEKLEPSVLFCQNYYNWRIWMLVFKNKRHYLKAKAWHDHGHDNNPKVPDGKIQEAQVVLISE